MVGVSAVPDVRKVPPRTPPQRLETLCRFAGEYINNRVATTGTDMTTDEDDNVIINENLNRPARAGIMVLRFQMMCEKMTDAFDKHNPETFLKRCSYFDPSVPNGGPRPVEQRKKRNQWIEEELAALEKGHWWGPFKRPKRAAEDRNRRSAEKEFEDPFDAFEANLERGIEGHVRLNSDVDVAFKEICVGFRKWSVRYLSECNGQQTHHYHTRRLITIANNLNELIHERKLKKF